MFFQQTAAWSDLGSQVIDSIESRYAADGLTRDRFGLVIVQDGADGPQGFAHRGDWRCYPCSLVKAFHLVHALRALEQGRIQPHDELDRAMHDMIAWSSNTATNYVIDILTGTTGDTLLGPDALAAWTEQREELNRFFQRLDWPEFANANITQKLMDDMRYGREAQYAGADGQNLNALTPLAAARLFHDLFSDEIPLGAQSSQRAQDILMREREGPKSQTPHYQVEEFLGAGIPADARIWSKAGMNSWTGDLRASYFKHDLIRIEPPQGSPFIVALMTQGKAVCEDKPDVFPQLGRLIYEMVTVWGRQR